MQFQHSYIVLNMCTLELLVLSFSLQESALSQKEREASQIQAELREQLTSARNELAEFKRQCETLRETVENVSTSTIIASSLVAR